MPDVPALRRLLSLLLPLDQDIEVFCQDYFPDVRRRYFARGMTPQEKVSYLLSSCSSQEILTKLPKYFADDPEALVTIATFCGQALPSAGLPQDPRWKELEPLYQQRAELLAQQFDAKSIDEEIAAVKRAHQAQQRRTDLRDGAILQGRYRLLNHIGRGGFANVWKALDRTTGRHVAIKVLRVDLAQEESQVTRFQRGARMLLTLEHPNIVRAIDGPIEEQGYHYFVMAYMSGGDLFKAVEQKSIDGRTALRIVLQVGSALASAHARGLIHRDVKPQNILLDQAHSTGYLSDFDLVWARDSTGGTRTGAMGTFVFAAPEQIKDGSRVDHRVDIYALAMTTLFVLHGELPSGSELYNRTELAQLIARLECPLAVKTLLRNAMDLNPDRRPPTMAAFCDELNNGLSQPNPPGSIPLSLVPPAKPKRRRWLVSILLALILPGSLAYYAYVSGALKPSVSSLFPPPPPPSPELIYWSLNTLPSDASVIRKSDGKVLGKTPWENSQPRASGKLTLILHKEGYKDTELELDESQSQAPPVARLVPVPSNTFTDDDVAILPDQAVPDLGGHSKEAPEKKLKRAKTPNKKPHVNGVLTDEDVSTLLDQ